MFVVNIFFTKYRESSVRLKFGFLLGQCSSQICNITTKWIYGREFQAHKFHVQTLPHASGSSDTNSDEKQAISCIKPGTLSGYRKFSGMCRMGWGGG